MNTVIQLKSCPRCRGDMMLEEYLGDSELVCLQCGHRSYPELQARQEASVHLTRKAA